MRIAITKFGETSAIGKVLTYVAAGLRERGVEVNFVTTAEEANEHDILHVGFIGMHNFNFKEVEVPMTFNLWHMATTFIERAMGFFNRYQPHAIVVDDITTFQLANQFNLPGVQIIPLAFDLGGYEMLPLVNGPFTVGLFGNDYPSKRFGVIIEACNKANIKCMAYKMCGEYRLTYDLDPVRDIYSNIDVLAHASFCDTNSMPVREALLCGRPVITTPNGGLSRVVRDGVNGKFYDGYVDDFIEKIHVIKDNYSLYRAGAIQCASLIVEDQLYSVDLYHKMFTKVYNEIQND